MKRHLIVIPFFIFLVVSVTGCLKSDTINADPEAATKTIAMEYVISNSQTTLNSGINYFSNGALTYPPTDEADTATFSVLLTGGVPVNQDVTVTVGPDSTAINDNLGNDSITYVQMPDSLFHLISNSATIKAGSHSANFQIVFYPSKIDPSQNYILPVTALSNTGDYKVSGNYGHIYFHVIGNPLAGSYTYSTTDPPFRYAYSGVITYNYPGPIPGGYTPLDLQPYYPKIAAPDNATTIEIPCANGFANYVISFNPDTYEITDVSLNPSNTVSNFLVYYANYDVATKTFHLVIHYNNVADPAGSGDDRIVDETLIKQ